MTYLLDYGQLKAFARHGGHVQCRVARRKWVRQRRHRVTKRRIADADVTIVPEFTWGGSGRDCRKGEENEGEGEEEAGHPEICKLLGSGKCHIDKWPKI